MSNDGFLKRWSRRKRGDAEPRTADAATAETSPPQHPDTGSDERREENQIPQSGQRTNPPDARQPAEEEEAIDPATLPPLESLGADSDYSVFLKKGVPEALRLAALRQAWASDPFIRDFRSPAIDYGWDFTTPDHALRPGDNVAKLLDQIFPPGAREPAQAEAPKTVASDEPRPAPNEASARATPGPVPQVEAAPAAARLGPPAEPQPHAQRRRHGGALPGEPD